MLVVTVEQNDPGLFVFWKNNMSSPGAEINNESEPRHGLLFAWFLSDV
jgi:hypothetical protein